MSNTTKRREEISIARVNLRLYGLHIVEYNPGDGTRWRVSFADDYFASDGIRTFLSTKELLSWVHGFAVAMEHRDKFLYT